MAVKNILTITDEDFSPKSEVVDTFSSKDRVAARAVLLDDKGGVFLINVSMHGYYKLPGGGVHEGESLVEALERELLEEVGCRAEVISELGSITEYRSYVDGGMKQISYCYIARQEGEQIGSSLEEDELAAGMVEIRASSIEDALTLLKAGQPDNLEGKFIQKRGIVFLEAAKEFMDRQSHEK